MKKGYITYLVITSVLAVAGTFGVREVIGDANAKLVAIQEQSAPEYQVTQQVASNDTAPSVEAPKPAPEPAKAAQAGPVSTGIAAAFAQKPKPAPAPKLPGAGASIDVGGAPSCADFSNLRQAVNPNPRATKYEGQLLIGRGSGAKLHPCTRARAFSNTGEPVGTLEKLPPGEYEHPTLGKFSVSRR